MEGAGPPASAPGRPHRPPAPWTGLAGAALLAMAVAFVLRGSVVEPFVVPGGSMVPALRPGDVLLVDKTAYGLRFPFSDVALRQRPGPRRGDVVVFHDPRRPGRHQVKRVVGLPGDVVELREQRLLVNGVPQPREELGELAYLEAGEGAAPPRADTCRRWRETVALGPVGPPAPEEAEPLAAAWGRAAAAGVAAYDVLQCRRIRAGRVEGPYGPVRAGHLFVLGDNRDRADDGRSDGGWQVPASAVVGRVTRVAWGRDPDGRGPERWTDRLFKPVE